MIALDTLQGLWLLPIIPLLWLLQRHRAQARPVTLATLPVLAPVLAAESGRAPRAFRLAPRRRWLPAAGALLLLALAACGLHLVISDPAPAERLVVLDNSSAFPAEALDALRLLQAGLGPRDTLAVLVTSPRPRLLFGDAGGGLDQAWSVLPAAPAPAVGGTAGLARLASELAAGRKVAETLVLSPRAAQWRAAEKRGAPAPPFRFPPERRVLRGNAGITAFDLRPSPSIPGRYDLFFRVESHGLPAGALSAALRSQGTTVREFALARDATGSARVEEKGVEIPPGPFSLELAVSDALASDDRVEGVIRPPSSAQDALTVSVTGPAHPFLLAALRSWPGFAVREGGGEGAVEVVVGTPFAPLPARPTLVIRPASDFFGLRFLRVAEVPGTGEFDPTHPLTREARFDNFRPPRVFIFAAPPQMTVAAKAGEAPLVLAGDIAGRRVVVWNFDPIGGGIFLDPSFPILLRLSLEWLADARPVSWEGTADLLSPEGTVEAAEVVVSDLAGLAWTPDGRTLPRRVELFPWLLAGALLLLLYRAAFLLFPSAMDEP